ncbi:MAG: methionyl-tRNA formyltransferase [Paludibacteraceae bacterium]|nr:methionyl-tRNA formyltransferase [Paludibacteraceae bacterium]
MGTPDFAVESLKVLVENNYNVVAVVTMPDKPAGRGHKLQMSPVKEYALEKGLVILQPEKLKDEQFLSALKALKADVQVVVAFRMLPEVVWNMPPLGTFNLHASLLPQYRGAAPINRAIMNGETETGATTFFLTHEIDTGKIILQERIPITQLDNAGTVHDRLMVMGAQMVRKTIDMLIAGKTDAVDQLQFISADTTLHAAPKIFKEDCELKTNIGLAEAHNFVRGLSPYPGAWLKIQLHGNAEKQVLKIFETETEFASHNDVAGTFVTDNKKFAKIAFPDGYLILKQIQAPGKKRMETGEYLRGLR